MENNFIAHLFKELELIEYWGTGIQRIKDLCVGVSKKEPLIAEKNDFFDVEFFRSYKSLSNNVPDNVPDNVPNNVPNNVPDNIEVKSSDRIGTLISLMTENSHITIAQLAKVFSVNEKTIKRDIEKLKNEGIVERVGSTKSGYWKVTI